MMRSKVRVLRKSLVVGNLAPRKNLDSETYIPEPWRNKSPSGPVERLLKKMDLLCKIIRDNQRNA